MAFIRRRIIKGVHYYSLVENHREVGKRDPKQVQLAWYGTYDEAVHKVEKSRLIPKTKQEYLTRLAKLEGLLDAGEVPLPENTTPASWLIHPGFTHCGTRIRPIATESLTLQ